MLETVEARDRTRAAIDTRCEVEVTRLEHARAG